MILAALYEAAITGAVVDAVDVASLAADWYAENPPAAEPPAAEPPAAAGPGATEVATASLFLAGTATASAIGNAVAAVLGSLWAEGWALGHGSASAVTAGTPPDWHGWVPGDADTARDNAGPGLDDFLRRSHGTGDSIAHTFADGLAKVLADAAHGGWGDAKLRAGLKGVLADPGHSRSIAHTEMCRAQFAAATEVYRDHGAQAIDVLTEQDDRVCPVCEALEAGNPHPLPDSGPFTLLPGHPLCRCVPVPTTWSADARDHAALLRRVLNDGYMPVETGGR